MRVTCAPPCPPGSSGSDDDPEHPEAAINRRISITVMNADAEERVLRTERIDLLRDATQDVLRERIDEATTSGN